MKADTLNLKEVFRKDIRYVVPMFQRPYVWNEEEHWNLLWEDIRQVVEELLSQRQGYAENNVNQTDLESETSPHFLGAIVLDQKVHRTKKLETREVIDGQQRLITIQILLSAARKVCKASNLERKASIFKKLIYNDEDLVEDRDGLLKIRPIKPDRNAFLRAMGTSGFKDGSDIKSNGEHQILKCYEFFLEQIKEWSEDGEYNKEERIDALETTIWSLIKLVVIDLENKDDAQVIFETLNARGTPLLAADLIKNYLFREATKTKRPSEELHEKYWKQFDEDTWREEVSQGRLERPRIDVFIMHWLAMKTTKQVRAKKLFPTFKNYLDKTEDSIEEVLKDINYYAEVYKRFSKSGVKDRVGVFFRRLDVMDTTTPYPVLLKIFGDKAITEENRIKAVEAIESWLIRRMLCRLTTKNYNNIFLDILEKLKFREEKSVDEEVIDFFQNKEGESEYWPDDKELAESIISERYWGMINQRRLKMIFKALERKLRNTGYSESLEITEKLHIEHILPQDWAHNWELPGERPEEVERIERDEVKNTFGNLTILTEKLNPSISNAAWGEKRKKIDEHSVTHLNNKLVKEWEDEWNEKTIEERGKWLSKQVAEVWPGPDSSYWD